MRALKKTIGSLTSNNETHLQFINYEDEWYRITELHLEKALETITSDFLKAQPEVPIGSKISIDITKSGQRLVLC